MSKALILVGPMGAGKTTFGKRLAKNCELTFTDTDSLIIKNHGPIAAIFENLAKITLDSLKNRVSWRRSALAV